MNTVVVLKFGGSSLADNEKLKNVANKIIEFYKKGNKVIAVVSAQGKTTDNLLNEANELCTNPTSRELDVLLSTGEQITISKLSILLNYMGYKTTSLTGWQAGIYTTDEYQNAKIIDIDTNRITKELNNNKVVIIAGFQGINEYNDITTLGRGGSDTSAVAIAKAINASECYIFSDVDGIYSADPNKIKSSIKLPEISYDEMINLSNEGAKVLHNRCVEIAQKYDIHINAKSSFNNNEGTIIKDIIEDNKIKSVIKDDNLYLITINKDRINLYDLYDYILNNNICFKNILCEKDCYMIVINKDEIKKFKNLMNSKKINVETNQISKISIIGNGIYRNDGIKNKIFNYLISNNIEILDIEMDEIKISIFFSEIVSDKVLENLHDLLIL